MACQHRDRQSLPLAVVVVIIASIAMFSDAKKIRLTTRSGASAIPPLPSLKVDPNTVTLSGFDSGAIFATQFSFAFSTIPKAVGTIDGAPYLCGQGSIAGSEVCTDTPWLLNAGEFADQARILAAEGKIQGLGNMSKQMAFVYAAKNDIVVNAQCSEMLATQLNDFNLGKVITKIDGKAEHAWVTSKYGNACGHLGSPYVNNCNYDFAGDFLKAAFDFMKIPFNPNASDFVSSHLWKWDQSEYGASDLENSMSATGYIYIPSMCNGTGKTCHLHVHFHGCDQSSFTMGGDGYVRQTQLNEWAEANGIVVLYPQAEPNVVRFNPMGCWDWFGYNNDDFFYLEYATANGAQLRIMNEVIQDIVSGLF